MAEPGEDNEFISVVQAVKLIPKNFEGNPRQLREFCEGVESAIQVVHPAKHPLLLKFIESKITGEAKDRLLARAERQTWEQIKAILEENYAVKRTLEYYAGILFTAKQTTTETVAQWGSRIDKMGIDLMREAKARIAKTNPRVVEGGIILVSEFMKGTFVAGLKDDRVKYIVKAKGEEHSLAQLVETALQEESEVRSQRYKGNYGNLTNPGNSRDWKPQIKREVNMVTSNKCFNCQRAGHKARECREKPTCGTCLKEGHTTKNCWTRSSSENRARSSRTKSSHEDRAGSSQGNRETGIRSNHGWLN
jgi:hypothetical protein